MSIPLNVSAQVTLNGSGNGTVSLGPSLPGVNWQPSLVSVSVSPTSGTTVSQFRLYLGLPVQQNLIGGTYTGDINSSGLSVTLWPGMILTGVWSGGNPGATAAMVLTGTQNVPSPR